MPTTLIAQVTRWTRSTNRRVAGEEVMRALAWLAIAAVIALGIHRGPALLGRIHLPWPQWLPAESTMATLAYVLGGVAAIAIGARAIVRYRRRRIDTLGMARRIDTLQCTDDLVATALAVEGGTVSGSADVQQVVYAKAQGTVAEVRRPLPSFSAPGRALIGAGVLTAAALTLPLLLDEVAALTIPAAEAAEDGEGDGAGEPAIPLDEVTKERIDKAIEQLQKYERNPALRREAKEQLAAAREHLQRALDDPKQAAASLSRAEQALRQLAKEARRDGLFDKQELSNMSNEELTKQMSKAMEQGQNDTAAELGKELARRMENGSESELRQMADAFKKQFPPTGTPSRPKDPSGEKSGEGEGKRESAEERRERWRKQLEEIAEDMKRGESGLSSSEMRRLSEELRGEAERGNGSLGRELDETLGEVRGARRRHLEELGKRGKGPGKGGKGPGKGGKGGKGPGKGGKGPGKGGPGKSGEGPGKGGKGGKGKAGEGKGEGGEGGEGDPSGKPGPGGGLGVPRYGFLPPGSIAPGERVDVPSGGPPKGAVRIIERAASGPGRDSKEYSDIHHEYSAVAEAAVRREEIPLTRRDYIRDYFQAVRPQ